MKEVIQLLIGKDSWCNNIAAADYLSGFSR